LKKFDRVPQFFGCDAYPMSRRRRTGLQMPAAPAKDVVQARQVFSGKWL